MVSRGLMVPQGTSATPRGTYKHITARMTDLSYAVAVKLLQFQKGVKPVGNLIFQDGLLFRG